MICAICLQPGGGLTRKQINGLPPTVLACDLCRDRIAKRDLGVTIKPDGSLSLYGTDGRGTRYPPDDLDAVEQSDFFETWRGSPPA